MPSRFYVYAFFRPNGQVCYIGKGQGDRWQTFRGRESNPHLYRLIRQFGGKLFSAKIKDGLTEVEAFALEVDLIRSLGRRPYGPLVNLTDRGDEIVDATGAIAAKISATMLKVATDPTWLANRRRQATLQMSSRKRRREHAAAIRSLYEREPERTAAHSAFMRQFNKDHPEIASTHSKRMTTRWSGEYGKRLRTIHNTKKTRQRHSRAAFKMWHDPKHKFEVSEKISATLKQLWQDPAYRRKMLRRRKQRGELT